MTGEGNSAKVSRIVLVILRNASSHRQQPAGRISLLIRTPLDIPLVPGLTRTVCVRQNLVF